MFTLTFPLDAGITCMPYDAPPPLTAITFPFPTITSETVIPATASQKFIVEGMGEEWVGLEAVEVMATLLP